MMHIFLGNQSLLDFARFVLYNRHGSYKSNMIGGHYAEKTLGQRYLDNDHVQEVCAKIYS